MIDRVHVENFKSLSDVSIDLAPLTVLVGANGAGKSSVLQAIWLAAKSGEPVENEGGLSNLYRFGRRFSGSFAPERVAPKGRTIKIDLRDDAGDELSVELVVPPSNSIPGDDRVKVKLVVTGSAGRLEATVGYGGAGENPFPTLGHPRVVAFATCEYLHLDAGLMARTSVVKTEIPRIASNGEGLASALAWLMGAEPEASQRIVEQLRAIVPGVKALRTLRERVTERLFEQIDVDGQPIWRPRDRPSIGDRFELAYFTGPMVPSDLLSEGTVLALGLLTILNQPGRPQLVLLDDVDRGLHIEAQSKLVAVLRGLLAADPGLQIVCTTHSPYLLDLFKPEEVRVLALDAERRTNAMPLTAHPDFERYRFGIDTGELFATLGDAWAAKSSANIEQSKHVVATKPAKTPSRAAKSRG